jgi:formate dehydrogenase subunit gamma
MTRGRVTGGWAWRHHRKWLKELVNGKGRSNAQTTPVK